MSLPRQLPLAAALLLGGLAAAFAWRALQGGPPAAPGAVERPDRERARRLLAQLGGGLAGLQERDGGFSLWAREERTAVGEPEVVRTAASALAAWALVEAESAGPERAGSALTDARGRALAYLLARQSGDERQGFGRLAPNPLGGVDRGPELTALCAGALALLRTRESAFAVPGGKAARALAAALREGPPAGWLRGVCALALDGLLALGRAGDLGRRPQELLPVTDPPPAAQCSDFRLAEALVRQLRAARGLPDAYPAEVLRTCIEDEPPLWNAQATDTRSWLLMSALAVRAAAGARWHAAALDAIEEGLTPAGLVPGSLYTDRVSMTACALLVVAQSLAGAP